ncbi:MAG: hypothetical protein HYX28_04890 [Candidatus Koribacter versatilis]|uniref:Uncharacterized protein n=1 Tax=Candidatus Korobacter versatilis TaxID=658062 RepID=A0A932A7F0_9BACT|nr:hypothetical protein [Candidatus Koribacter versatilis]
MKNTVRIALVALSLAGIYAGMSTPAPAANQQHKTIMLSEGTDPTPTTLPPPTPTKPSNPKTT